MVNKKKNIVIPGSRERSTLLDIFWSDEHSDRPTIIFCHGYKGFKDWGAWDLMAEYFTERGFTLVKFNFSYNGGTIEEPIDFPDLEAFAQNNYSTELNDLGAVIDWCEASEEFKNTGSTIDNLFLIGHSRGGGIATLRASQDSRVHKLVTWAAVSDFEERFGSQESIEEWRQSGIRSVLNSRTGQEMPHYFQYYEDFISHKSDLEIRSAAAHMDKPWLIVHAEDDEAVSVGNALDLAVLDPHAELYLLESGGHTFGQFHPYTATTLPEPFEPVCRVSTQFLFGD